MKIITTDVLAPELPYVKDGYVQALVGQDYWGWGYQTVSILHNLLTQKTCHYPMLVPQAGRCGRHFPENVDQWIAKWQQASTPAGAAEAFKEAPLGCMYRTRPLQALRGRARPLFATSLPMKSRTHEKADGQPILEPASSSTTAPSTRWTGSPST